MPGRGAAAYCATFAVAWVLSMLGSAAGTRSVDDADQGDYDTFLSNEEIEDSLNARYHGRPLSNAGQTYVRPYGKCRISDC